MISITFSDIAPSHARELTVLHQILTHNYKGILLRDITDSVENLIGQVRDITEYGMYGIDDNDIESILQYLSSFVQELLDE